MKYSVFTLICAMVLVGCGRGPVGAAGPKGDTGAQGIQGERGDDGADAILEVIDPCGDSPSVVDEILLRLADGSVLCSFSANSSGKNTRLAILPPGNYVTTDGSSCVFTVNADGTISD